VSMVIRCGEREKAQFPIFRKVITSQKLGKYEMIIWGDGCHSCCFMAINSIWSPLFVMRERHERNPLRRCRQAEESVHIRLV
jgi:hypothetical protein